MPATDKELELLLKEIVGAADAYVASGVEALQEEITATLDTEHGKAS